jgi:hypothetical protein
VTLTVDNALDAPIGTELLDAPRDPVRGDRADHAHGDRADHGAGGRGGFATVDGGYGLTGMRERLLLVGGALDAGVRDGRWVVTAEVPR